MSFRTLQLLSWSLAITVCLFMFSGCVGFGQHTIQPRVTLADIQLQEIKTMETAFQIELRILNPNETPMSLSGIECALKLDGKHFASGVAGANLEIPAYGSTTVPVTVYASVLDMVSSVISFVQGATSPNNQPESLKYELSGHVRLSGKNVKNKTIPFESKGELSFNGESQ